MCGAQLNLKVIILDLSKDDTVQDMGVCQKVGNIRDVGEKQAKG